MMPKDQFGQFATRWQKIYRWSSLVIILLYFLAIAGRLLFQENARAWTLLQTLALGLQIILLICVPLSILFSPNARRSQRAGMVVVLTGLGLSFAGYRQDSWLMTSGFVLFGAGFLVLAWPSISGGIAYLRDSYRKIVGTL